MKIKELLPLKVFPFTLVFPVCRYHTCQVLRKSKSEIACGPLSFACNLVIRREEKSGAQVLRVIFFSLFKQT